MKSSGSTVELLITKLVQHYSGQCDASQETLSMIAGVANRFQLEKGDALVREGDTLESMLVLESGSIRVFKLTPGGRQITLYRVLPGEGCILATYALLSNAPFPASAIAEERSTGWKVPGRTVKDLFAHDPTFQGFACNLVIKTIGTLIMLVEDVVFRKMDERLAAFLVQESHVSAGVSKAVTLTHEQIANHLGTAREVVSRLLSTFEGDGLVDLSRRSIRVLDGEGLRKWATQGLPAA